MSPAVHRLLSAQVRERPDKGVYVKDLSTYVVKSPEHMDKLMLKGAKNSKSLAHSRLLAVNVHIHDTVDTIVCVCTYVCVHGTRHTY